jgi:type III restriction enzyme
VEKFTSKGDAEIRDTIKLRQTRPFVVKDQGYVVPKKSIFNRVIGDSHLELVFANFLERCTDVVSYAKNYFAVHFKIDYVNADGTLRISRYRLPEASGEETEEAARQQVTLM